MLNHYALNAWTILNEIATSKSEQVCAPVDNGGARLPIVNCLSQPMVDECVIVTSKLSLAITII